GAILFDLTAQRPDGPPPSPPVQLGRTDALARLYGDQSGIQAGRSFAVTDLEGDGTPELVLGAPNASTTRMVNGMNVTQPLTGRVLVYALGGLTAGTVRNTAAMTRGGENRTDVLGTAVTGWVGAGDVHGIVALAGRATTALGDFTGRVDVFTGTGDLATWTNVSAALPNQPAAEQFGIAVAVGVLADTVRAMVGSPNIAGASGDGSGSDVGAGRAWLYSAAAPSAPQVAYEGSFSPYVTDGGWRAFGGRTMAADVTVTDFNGDGLMDFAVAAPNFVLPTRLADGGVGSPGGLEYSVARAACMPPVNQNQNVGAAFVSLGQPDGTFREGFRVWAPRDVPGADGGVAFQRVALSRNGLGGGFDFDGDGKGDLAMTRTNGLEIFAGRVADDAQAAKPSMACDPLFTLAPTASSITTSSPVGLGDLNGDGCDELGLRYTDSNQRFGVYVFFGFGTRCSSTQAAWVRISGDGEAGLNNMRLGTAMSRAGAVVAGDSRDMLAITADLYPYLGVAQPTVLLFPVAQVVAKKPASGEQLVGALGDGLVPIPVVYLERAPGFGRILGGGFDVTGDGTPDLVVGATGANVNGDGTGAVFVFGGGTVVEGPSIPEITIVADERERASFGQELSVTPRVGTVPPALSIGAPLSYRSGTSNGTAFLLPLDF
ncbi:MAG: FG-GAP repeat protein, partial [Archangium sp.]|nr:FG-GAP repeat protein [Archangium sp.]